MSRDRDTVFFISDAHFGVAVQGVDDRLRLFRNLAADMRRRATDLYIVGDLFDF